MNDSQPIRNSKHLVSSLKVMVKDIDGVDVDKIKDIMAVANSRAADSIYKFLKEEGFPVGSISDNITVGTMGIREDQP